MSKSLRIRAPIDPIAAEYKELKYDASSGALYTETIVTGISAADLRWQWKSLGKSGSKSGRPTAMTGAPSLEDMAMRSCLQNLSGINVDALQWVPWRLGERMWKEVLRNQLDSFHIWRVFATVYHEEEEPTLKYHRQSLIKPSITLDGYITPILSDSCHWITYLSISKVVFSRTELVDICKLVNIGALDILASSNPHPDEPTDTVEDSIVRAWSRAATEDGAFSKLRVLMLRNHKRVTSRSLEYINAFPSLTLYNVTGCQIDSATSESKARKLGWSSESGRDLLDALNRDKEMARSWDLPIRACFLRAGGLLSLEQAKSNEVERINNKPVLNFRIGPSASEDLYTAMFKPQMLFFQRLPQEDANPIAEGENSKKVELETEARTQPPPSKRRKVKTSKHKTFEDLLKEFQGM